MESKVAGPPAGGGLPPLAPEMLDAQAVRAWWIRRLHPAGPCCPQCSTSLTGVQRETFAAGGRIRCNACGRWYSYRTGTLLQSSAADDCQLYLLAALTQTERLSVAEIAAACQLCTDTVRSWQRRLQEAARG